MYFFVKVRKTCFLCFFYLQTNVFNIYAIKVKVVVFLHDPSTVIHDGVFDRT